MAQHFKKILNQHIDKAQSVIDLLPMLHFVDLGVIKNIIKNKINHPNNKTKQIYYASLPITTILPDVIIQQIASFSNSRNIKFINQSFNKCVTLNKKLRAKEKEKQIIHKFENKPFTTLIVHQTRTQLNDKEKKLKYYGPFNSLTQAINFKSTYLDVSAHKILVYDGKYNLDARSVIQNKKNIQIIGVGNNVILVPAINNKYCYAFSKINVYLKNIKLALEYIVICSGNTLFMENCDLNFGNSSKTSSRTVDFSIEVNDGGSLKLFNCDFYGIKKPVINIKESSKSVFIEDCNFIGCGINKSTPCIAVHQSVNDYNDDIPITEITCIGNYFENINLPIGIEESEFPFIPKGRFNDNMLQNDCVDVMYSFAQTK